MRVDWCGRIRVRVREDARVWSESGSTRYEEAETGERKGMKRRNGQTRSRNLRFPFLATRAKCLIFAFWLQQRKMGSGSLLLLIPLIRTPTYIE